MIPVRDVIPSRTTPWITVTLLAAIGIAFVGGLLLDPASRRTLLADYGLTPGAISVRGALASLFLHTSWLAAAANALALWICGPAVEDRLGHGRFLALYLGCGYAAALIAGALGPASGSPVVGATAAVAAVMGAYFFTFKKSRLLVLVPYDVVELPALFLLALWFLLQAIATSPVNGRAVFVMQAAGFVLGAVLVRPLRRRERQHPAWWQKRLSDGRIDP